jgi:hypothetical protein
MEGNGLSGRQAHVLDLLSEKRHTANMTKRRRVITFGLFVTLVMLLSSMPGHTGSTTAHTVPYGWWNCTQAYRTSYNPVYVGVATVNYAFPSDSYGDGVINSFTDRIADAAAHLNAVVLGSVGRPFGVGYAGANPAVSVQFQYRETPSPQYLGWTNVSSGCTVVHGSRVAIPQFFEIFVDPLPSWFTQDNSRRPIWEKCKLETSSYTCGKTQDAGGTILHELGHAMGLAHPESVDVHAGSGTSVNTLAKCQTTDAATMCPAMKWRSNRRTLEVWDVISLQYALQ